MKCTEKIAFINTNFKKLESIIKDKINFSFGNKKKNSSNDKEYLSKSS